MTLKFVEFTNIQSGEKVLVNPDNVAYIKLYANNKNHTTLGFGKTEISVIGDREQTINKLQGN